MTGWDSPQDAAATKPRPFPVGPQGGPWTTRARRHHPAGGVRILQPRPADPPRQPAVPDGRVFLHRVPGGERWLSGSSDGGPRAGTVLDPFCGSGTTGMVALKHGRRFVGIDLSATYLDLALRTRLNQGALIDEVRA